MSNIRNIELLPKFFEDIKAQIGSQRLDNEKYVIALMSDLLPDAAELKRCMRMVYESSAMKDILAIDNEASNVQLNRSKAIDKMVVFSFMDKYFATEIVDHVIAAVYPGIKTTDDSAEEQYVMGSLYYEQQDYVNAVTCYRDAAERGYAEAQYELGKCYAEGTGVSQDYEEAVHWYKKAADQEYVPAWQAMGLSYYRGHGVSKDYTQALYWFRKAAEQGYAAAINCVGICYDCGYGVSQDLSQAANLYRKAAEQGYAKAQCNLGLCYAKGRGVSKDMTQAAAWYRKAADNGSAAAQCNLGNCYYYGNGVGKDLVQSAAWYRKGSDNGSVAAQCNLGKAYEYGEGVSKDLSQAEFWYEKAAQQGNEAAQQGLARVRNVVNEQNKSSGNVYSPGFVVVDDKTGKPIDMSQYVISVPVSTLSQLEQLKESAEMTDAKEKKQLISQLAFLLQHKLKQELDSIEEVLRIYELMRIPVPQDLVRIKKELLKS